MKSKALIIFIGGLSFFYTADGQKILSLKDIKKMMVEARSPDSLNCMVIAGKDDTTKADELDWEWNKKKKEGEFRIAGKVIPQDSVFFYQDKDGFHALSHFKSSKLSFTNDHARIMKGKIDVFVSNWDSRGKGSDFNPAVTTPSGNRRGLDRNQPIGYIPGTSSYTASEYFIRKKKATPTLVTYGKLKEFISDNSAALAQYNMEFKGNEDPAKGITDWGKIKKILEIYNQ